MTLLIGGNFASGGLYNWQYQSAGSGLNNRIRLVKPRGFPSMLETTTYQRDYVTHTSLRSELSAPSYLFSWDKVYKAAWTVVIPEHQQVYAGETATTVLQLHDLNLAAISRRPSFAGELHDGFLDLILSHDDFPAGDVLASVPAIKGSIIHIAVIVRWADATNVASSEGYLELYINDSLTAVRRGKNHWATVDSNPPYIKVGVYVPTYATWWNNRQRHMWHIGAAIVDGSETLEYLKTLINTESAVFSSFGAP